MQEIEIRIRWRDLDAYGHVNNAVYLNYLEECRDRWVDAVLGKVADTWDFVLARVAIDYRSELTRDDGQIVVRCRLDSVGRSSVRTKEEIVKPDGSTAAVSESVLVPRETETGKSRPLTEQELVVLRSELERETAARG